MTPEKLTEYIKNPSNRENVSTDALWQLVKEYPYFQAARVLLAKNLHDTKHDAFPLALRIAAAYAGNRSILKKLIEQKETKESTLTYAGTETTISTLVQSEEISDTANRESKTDKELAKEIEDTHLSETSLIAEPAELIKNQEQLAQENEQVDSEQLTKELEQVEPSQSQNPLIDHLRRRLLEIPVDENEILKETEEKEVIPQIASHTSNQKDLIDKFIREEPRISTPKKEFFNPEDIAKQSTYLPNDIVTETLASIYEQQGHFNTAIKIYEKLMLLFPEKNRYFAGRIEEIQKKRK